MADCSSQKTFLVLLYRFSEAQDSILGYELCQRLVLEGHDLLVTSTARTEELKKEIEDAERITSKFRGSITVLSPECEEFEEPSFEWIAKFHKTYFGYLSELENVHTIIGLLPGTTKTAVDLKAKLKCKLALLATAKIGTDKQDLKAEINRLSENADDIWSVGTDLFTHFNSIFQESPQNISDKHKEITLIPSADFGKIPLKAQDSPGIRKLVSLWNPGISFIHRGRQEQSQGSSQQNFKTVAAAVAKINEENLYNHEATVEWHVHGMKGLDLIAESIKGQAVGDLVELVALQTINSLDDIKFNNCLAFIVPDRNEDTFNYAALFAMWQGIPTLVSSQSSIGKWLLKLLKQQCPEVDRCVITLTGDSQSDMETWVKSIQKHILHRDANPFEWATKLKEFLLNMSNISELGTLNFAKDIDKTEFRATNGVTIDNMLSKVNRCVIA